jgi:hypothetical protein
VKNSKIANNSTTAKARENRNTDLEYLDILKVWVVYFTKFKNNKISDRFILKTKLYTE